MRCGFVMGGTAPTMGVYRSAGYAVPPASMITGDPITPSPKRGGGDRFKTRARRFLSLNPPALGKPRLMELGEGH